MNFLPDIPKTTHVIATAIISTTSTLLSVNSVEKFTDVSASRKNGTGSSLLDMTRFARFIRFFLLFSFLLFPFLSSAQQKEQRENKKVKFIAKVETRNSFVQTHYATFLGIRAGLEFKFPIRCGIGYYWMLTNLDSKFYKPSDFGQTDLTARPKMRYVIGYVDFSFYEEDDWTLSVPVQIGVGETFYRSENSKRFANGLVVPMEAGISVDYLFTKWIGFGVGLGYRVMLKGNKQVRENFNSPYYQIRLNIAFSEIFREIKSKKKKKKG